MEEGVQYSTVAPVFEGIPVVSNLGAGIQDPPEHGGRALAFPF